MTHTPGPWTLSRERVVGPAGNTIADCRYKNGVNDARLIAAAPEMHAKLAELRDGTNCVCKLNEIVAPLGAGIPCIRCSLDSLLAKATGGAK